MRSSAPTRATAPSRAVRPRSMFRADHSTSRAWGNVMKLPVHVELSSAVPPLVDYRWDPDTDILSARMRLVPGRDGDTPAAATPAEALAALGSDSALSGAVGVEGRDGSWLLLDVE